MTAFTRVIIVLAFLRQALGTMQTPSNQILIGLALFLTFFIICLLYTSVLERARAGLYTQIEINRGLPAALLTRYFDKQGLHWRLKSEIRRMVDFQQSNLVQAWPSFPSLDVIFLRNVLIYFGVETKRAILARVRGILKPDGYLFLGSSETTLNLDPAFEPITLGKTVCYQLRQTNFS